MSEVTERPVSFHAGPPIYIAWPQLDVVMVYILGLPGTGKTTMAAKLTHHWKRFKYKYRPVIVYGQVGRPSDINRIIEGGVDYARARKSRAVALVFDDATFVLSSDKSSRYAINSLMKLRHFEPGVRWWLVVIIGHYSRSVPPALRNSHVKVLTSITPVEIEQLKSVFPEPALWDFWEIWGQAKRPGWALIDNMGDVRIVRWKKPKLRFYWDYVVE